MSPSISMKKHVAVDLDEEAVLAEHVADGAALDAGEVDARAGKDAQKLIKGARTVLAGGAEEHFFAALRVRFLPPHEAQKAREVALFVGDVLLREHDALRFHVRADDARRMRVELFEAFRRRTGVKQLGVREVRMKVLRALADRLLVRIDALDRIAGNAFKHCKAMVDRKDELFDGEGRVGAFVQNAPLDGIFDGQNGKVRLPLLKGGDGGVKIGAEDDLPLSPRKAQGSELGIAPLGSETAIPRAHAFSAMSRMSRSVSSQPRQGSVMDCPKTISCF